MHHILKLFTRRYDASEQTVNFIHNEHKDVQRMATVVLRPGRGGELSIPMSKPLRVEIRELVVNHLQTKLATGEQIDVAEMTYEIAQSLVDVIMEQEEEGRERSSPSPSRAWARNICNGEALWTLGTNGHVH